MNKSLGAAAMLAASLFFLTACENEGPMEKLGENVDDAVEEAGEKVEEAADQVKDATN